MCLDITPYNYPIWNNVLYFHLHLTIVLYWIHIYIKILRNFMDKIKSKFFFSQRAFLSKYWISELIIAISFV